MFTKPQPAPDRGLAADQFRTAVDGRLRLAGSAFISVRAPKLPVQFAPAIGGASAETHIPAEARDPGRLSALGA